MRNYSISDTKWKKRGHELDEIAEALLNQKNEYFVIGNKNEVASFYERGEGWDDISIRGFVLSDTGDLQNFMGKPVVTEDDILVDANTVIICVARERQEYEACKVRWGGVFENYQFIAGELFSMIYDVYKKGEIRIDRVEIFMTSCCTLNCENCIAYIPYFRFREHIPIETLKEDADILFGKVDYVYKLKVLGGEGLLYPDLIEYMDYLHDNYKEKIGSIRIGTNGTIFPTQEIVDMCKRDNVMLDISDYTMAVPERCKLDAIKQLCIENGVDFDIKRTGEQWLDIGFPNNIPEKKSETELAKHFHKCAMFCRQFSQGKMYFCCSNFAAIYAGLFPENENDYFDFRNDFTKQELLEYELGYSPLGHTTFCSVCRGCSNEANPNQVEVAKQVVQQ